MKVDELIGAFKKFIEDNPKPSDYDEVFYMNSKTFEKLNLPAAEVPDTQLDIAGIPVKINDIIPDNVVYKTNLSCRWEPDHLLKNHFQYISDITQANRVR